MMKNAGNHRGVVREKLDAVTLKKEKKVLKRKKDSLKFQPVHGVR